MKHLLIITLLLLSLALHAGVTVYSAPNEAGLVGYWKMDEGGLTNVIDYSGNGNNGTNINGATLTNGVVGGALGFNGMSQYIAIPITNLSQGTISAWAYPNLTGSSSNYIVCRGHNGGGFFQNFILGPDGVSNTVWRIQCADSGGTVLAVSSGVYIVKTNWQFVCGTFSNNASSTTCNIYVNGILAGTATRTTGTLGTLPQTTDIGAYDGALNFFNGFIDDVRIYNRVLSATEITNLYNFRQTTYLINGTTPFKP